MERRLGGSACMRVFGDPQFLRMMLQLSPQQTDGRSVCRRKAAQNRSSRARNFRTQRAADIELSHNAKPGRDFYGRETKTIDPLLLD